MRVHWTREAVDNLAAIRDFIAKDALHFAAVVIERLVASVEQLETFPESGRRLPERPEATELLR